MKQHRDGVSFLTRRARRAPNPERRIVVEGDELPRHVQMEGSPREAVAKEGSDPDHEVGRELVCLSFLRPEHPQVLLR